MASNSRAGRARSPSTGVDQQAIEQHFRLCERLPRAGLERPPRCPLLFSSINAGHAFDTHATIDQAPRPFQLFLAQFIEYVETFLRERLREADMPAAGGEGEDARDSRCLHWLRFGSTSSRPVAPFGAAPSATIGSRRRLPHGRGSRRWCRRATKPTASPRASAPSEAGLSGPLDGHPGR